MRVLTLHLRPETCIVIIRSEQDLIVNKNVSPFLAGEILTLNPSAKSIATRQCRDSEGSADRVRYRMERERFHVFGKERKEKKR